MIPKSPPSSRNQMTVSDWWKTASLCCNFCVASVHNVDWYLYLVSRDICKHGLGMQFYIWRCSHEYCLQEDAFSAFIVERRSYMFCVCICVLNDPALLLRSLCYMYLVHVLPKRNRQNPKEIWTFVLVKYPAYFLEFADWIWSLKDAKEDWVHWYNVNLPLKKSNRSESGNHKEEKNVFALCIRGSLVDT